MRSVILLSTQWVECDIRTQTMNFGPKNLLLLTKNNNTYQYQSYTYRSKPKSLEKNFFYNISLLFDSSMAKAECSAYEMKLYCIKSVSY